MALTLRRNGPDCSRDALITVGSEAECLEDCGHRTASLFCYAQDRPPYYYCCCSTIPIDTVLGTPHDMGYDWDDKRHVCYQLYVEEKKSLDEVVDYFRDKLDFVPRYVLLHCTVDLHSQRYLLSCRGTP